MDLHRKHRTQLVVPPSPWSVNTVLLVTVFLVTSGLVYHWTRVSGRPHLPSPTDAKAEVLRQQRRVQTEQAHAFASAAAEKARLQWQQAEIERQEFLDRFLEQPREAPPAAQIPAAPPDQPQPEPRSPVENPEWSKLNRQLGQMEQRYAELLSNMTADHPRVREVANELGEARRTLTGTPRWLHANEEATLPREGRHAMGLPGPVSEPAAHPDSSASRHVEARRHYNLLERQVEEARSRYEQLAAEERAAWSAHVRESDTASHRPAPNTGAANAAEDHALTVALLAGMAMMVGVGMFATGASMEPTVNSEDQVAASLGMPVLATVTLPGLRPTVAGYRRTWLRLASCLGGVVLMVGCLGLVYRAITG